MATAVLEQTKVPLTALDRCDVCPAAARVRVTVKSGDLVFCGHHFTKHEVALVAQGALVDDQRNL